MAKQKRKTAASKSNSKSGYQPIIIIVVLLLVAASVYGLIYLSETSNFEPIFLGGSDEHNEKSFTPTKKLQNPSAENKRTDDSELVPQGKKEKKIVPPIQKEVVEETVSPNKDLPEYTSVDKYYFRESFDFAWPEYTQNDQIIEHEYYTLKYNEKTEQADWVAYKLTGAHVRDKRFKRKNNFRTDPMVLTKSSHPTDYKGSGFDRGHLAPAGDFTWDEEALSETFFMSNMSPQSPQFNRGAWKKLEETIRTWAKNHEELFIVTGPLYGKTNKKIGKNKVVIPRYYFKVIIDVKEPGIKAIAFILPNEEVQGELYEYAISVDELEKESNLDFFPSIPDDLENKIESYHDYSAW